MFTYHCLNSISKHGLNLLTEDYTYTEELQDAQAILVRSASMHETKFPENLVAIARAGAGVNNIPLERCSEEGIVVFNTPGANANGVKELVIASLVLGARDFIGGAKWVEENKTDTNINKTMEKAKAKFAGTEIKGKKLGVVGLGAIGVLVANAANRLGMDVYGCDPFLSVEHALNLSRDVTLVKKREDIFKQCDYITVHVPLLDDTKEMIRKETLDLMKDGVVILNFARDLLVKDDDLEVALKSGKVKKYITDFPNAKTANMEGVIAFPHLGASTMESEDNCAKMAVKEVMAYMEYGSILNSVNYPICEVGSCNSKGRIVVNHRNVPNMLSQFTTIFSQAGINIDHMINKSRGNYAYSVFDISVASTKEVLDQMLKIEGVLKVRGIK